MSTEQHQEVNVGTEEVLVRVPGAVVHLIDKSCSVELARGDFDLVRLLQNGAVVALLARMGGQIQWPLAKDEPVVKIDASHYFFSIRLPSDPQTLNYGLTVPAEAAAQLDNILAEFSSFSVGGDGGVNKEVEAAAYWAAVAPEVEEYSSRVARAIAGGSGKVAEGILWCGDVTVDSLNRGNAFLKNKMGTHKKPDDVSRVSPETNRRIQRVKKVTQMSEEMAEGILSGVVKVTGYVTGAIVNSKPGTKFFNILPGQVVLATLDGFNKVWDAVEVVGKNVMSTSSVVSTELVTGRYGEDAGMAAKEGLGAAGHAVGTAWALFKITKAINPKSVIKPTTLAKAKKRS